jgi:hypothetical protein
MVTCKIRTRKDLGFPWSAGFFANGPPFFFAAPYRKAFMPIAIALCQAMSLMGKSEKWVHVKNSSL